MLVKGFGFGLLLQLAIGPVCMFIFQLGVRHGAVAAEVGVLGVVLVDGLFICAAILGLARLMEAKRIQAKLQLCGAAILGLFGLDSILTVFQPAIAPSLSLPVMPAAGQAFAQAALLTAANPLTILFWTGVFSSQINSVKHKGVSMYWFGLGALLSTLCFLSVVAFIGGYSKNFISGKTVQYLQILVGIALLYFSAVMLRKNIAPARK